MTLVTHVRHEHPILGDRWPAIEAFMNAPEHWLPPPAHAMGDMRWRIDVHAGPLHRLVALTLGTPRTLPDAHIRTLAWEPVPAGQTAGQGHGAMLPSFQGQIELRDTAEGLRLVVEGRYSPPGATVDALLDTVALHRVADQTLAHMADEISQRLRAH